MSKYLSLVSLFATLAAVFGTYCDDCGDKETTWMDDNHKSCGDYWFEKHHRCHDKFWHDNKICQKSCYPKAHVLYDGCCPPTTYPKPYPKPTPKPRVETFIVSLKPDAEVFQEKDPFKGMLAGEGDVELVFNEYENKACIDTVIKGFPPALAHVHQGPINDNGDVAFDFSSLIHGNTVKGCVGPVNDRFSVTAVLNNPSNYYANMHVGLPETAPGGNKCAFFQGIRQQLISSLETTLEPEQEVLDPESHPPQFLGVHGASGTGFVSFHNGGTVICVDVNIQGMTPGLLHIHQGERGQNGGIIFDFSKLIKNNNDGSINGCVDVDDFDRHDDGFFSSDDVVAILANPSDFYFNAHDDVGGTDGFRFGIRGQFD